MRVDMTVRRVPARPRACSVGLALALLAAVLQAGCASLEGDDYAVHDTNPDLNRASFKLSESLDRRFFAPVARTYQDLTPDLLEQGVENVFANLRSVNSSANGFLQGDFRRGGTDLLRLAINTTVGLGGLLDVAARSGLEHQGEDFGQTLAVWGWKNSRYVYVPLAGPATVRDLPGMILSAMMPRFLFGADYPLWATGLDLVSTRASALALTDARDAAALDPYVFTREAYYQRREFQIFNGQPPLDDFDAFFDEADLTE